MIQTNLATIPPELRDRPQWVLWKSITRDGKPTKVPFQPSGQPGKSNDPATWSDFETVSEHVDGYAGIGFMFAADDPFCGIDLDGCRDPQTQRIAGWAREIISSLNSYAEVSPSQTGVKIFCRGVWTGQGRKLEIADAERICAKTPAIEVYDRLRYFALTGLRVKGFAEIHDRQTELNALHERFWKTPAPETYEPPRDFRDPKSVFERARAYLAKMPPAISGQDGHGRTYHAACVICCGFGLGESDAMELMREYNQTCEPLAGTLRLIFDNLTLPRAGDWRGVHGPEGAVRSLLGEDVHHGRFCRSSISEEFRLRHPIHPSRYNRYRFSRLLRQDCAMRHFAVLFLSIVVSGCAGFTNQVTNGNSSPPACSCGAHAGAFPRALQNAGTSPYRPAPRANIPSPLGYPEGYRPRSAEGPRFVQLNDNPG